MKLSAWLDKHVGLPLYYCSDCGAAVKVKGGAIKRKCECTGVVVAPRKVFLHGSDKKPSLKFKLMVKAHQIASAITGRNV